MEDFKFSTIEEAVADLRAGKMIIAVDDPDRENEGDQICAAEFATLENVNFMASYAYYNKKEKRYILGYPVQVVSENCDPRITYTPTFELSYWLTGLRIAQDWEKRLKVKANPEYEKVRTKLSKLPVKDGVYVSWENITDMWTKYNFAHPALIGAYGMLPGDGGDIPTMQRTLDRVEQAWQFHETWGWDFPMLAMTAARLGKP